jgi:hypothetical protein
LRMPSLISASDLPLAFLRMLSRRRPSCECRPCPPQTIRFPSPCSCRTPHSSASLK